jgi:rsbT co-antagonist protein RsbR
MTEGQSVLDILHKDAGTILDQWVALQLASGSARPDLIGDDQLRQQSKEVLDSFARSLEAGTGNLDGPQWEPAREAIARVVSQRGRLGFSASQTAMFVMSLKQPLFSAMSTRVTNKDDAVRETWAVTRAIDHLAVHATEVYQKSREAIIIRQQSEMLELSTPVVTLWKGVLALPLIGTLDSERTQGVMESLLQRIVDSGSTIAILDITGVPTVDTLVAQHLLKTVAAARLMGADCIISGVRPQIAQTIVHLGIDLNSVTTKATLADAFALALDRLGLTVARRGSSVPKES